MQVFSPASAVLSLIEIPHIGPDPHILPRTHLVFHLAKLTKARPATNLEDVSDDPHRTLPHGLPVVQPSLSVCARVLGNAFSTAIRTRFGAWTDIGHGEWGFEKNNRRSRERRGPGACMRRCRGRRLGSRGVRGWNVSSNPVVASVKCESALITSRRLILLRRWEQTTGPQEDASETPQLSVNGLMPY